MNQDRSDGQVKAFKFAIYAFIFCIVFAAAVGFFAGLPRRLNEQAAQKLYRNTELTQSSEAPVIKRPYTVYGRKSTNTWKYKGGISGTKLITDAGITESVKKARTCVLVWADTSQMKKSEKYVWGNGQRKDRDAYFCPVYMTVIDREDGVRYDDIKLGTVPLQYQYSSKIAGTLYSSGSGFSSFSLDVWLDGHWEKTP